MKKVVYFTAGAVPTQNEQSDIQKLQALAKPSVELTVLNASEDATYDPVLIKADKYLSQGGSLVADGYDKVDVEDYETAKEDLTTCAPPLDTEAIVGNGDELEVADVAGGKADVTLSVAGNKITGAVIDGDFALVELGEEYDIVGASEKVTITIEGGNLKFTVA